MFDASQVCDCCLKEYRALVVVKVHDRENPEIVLCGNCQLDVMRDLLLRFSSPERAAILARIRERKG